MTNILFATAPIFLLIVLGYVVKIRFLTEDSFWQNLGKLTFWVFMPALFFYQTATVKIATGIVFDFSLSLVIGFIVALIFALVANRIFNFASNVKTSVIQGSIRLNAFLAIAIINELLPKEALGLASLAMAILIPLANIATISFMTYYNQKTTNPKELALRIIKGLITNPLFVSIILGIIYSQSGFMPIPIIFPTLDVLGSICIPIILLSVGASIRFGAFYGYILPISVSCIIKMLILPLVVYFLGINFGFNSVELAVAVLFAMLPTATSSFTFAEQMGGDFRLMGSIITVQTILIFLLLPILFNIL